MKVTIEDRLSEYPEVSPRTIWNWRQNSPELVVQDLRKYLGLDERQCEFVRTVLLARGVNKWLRNRLLFISHKKQLKHEILALHKELATFDTPEKRKGSFKCYSLKHQLKLLERERCVLREICKSPRWFPWPKANHIRDGIKRANPNRVSDTV